MPNTPNDRHVAALYRAAVGECPWGEPLEGMRHHLDALGVHLHGVRLPDGAVAFSYEVGGLVPEGVLAYITQYHRIDPRAALVIERETLSWINCEQHFDEHFVANNRFYQEFLIPYGGRWVSGTKVYQDDDLVAVLGIHRGPQAAPLNAAEDELGRRYAMHLHQALGLWRRQRRVINAALIGNALIERLGHPVLLVDEQMQLLHANELARELLARDPRLAERSGTLSLTTRAQADAVLRALRRLRLGGPSSYRELEPAQPRAAVRVEGEGRAPLLLMMSALHPAETMGAFGTRSLALVLVHDLGQPREPDPFVLSSAFGLTPAEGRVAARLAAGDSAQEIAGQNGVALSTIRTQVRNVYEKVGVTRQGELVAALAALPSLG